MCSYEKEVKSGKWFGKEWKVTCLQIQIQIQIVLFDFDA